MTRYADNPPELTARRPARRQRWLAPPDWRARVEWFIRFMLRPKSVTRRTGRGTQPQPLAREPRRLSRPALTVPPSGQAAPDKSP